MKPDQRLFWADRIAQQVKFHVEREPIFQEIVKNRGWICYDEKTPSGQIHIGSGRGWVIHDTVAQALKDIGLKAQFILSSDDMDPMDKLPKHNPEKWQQYMGMPFRDIPSPKSGFISYAEYYFWEATSKFDEYGIKAQLESTGERYIRGDFNDTIKLALDNSDKIWEIFNRFREDDSRKTKLPFNPICENCGKIGTTRAFEWDSDHEMIKYICEEDLVTWAKGCKYQGERSPYNGGGKFAWKVEWAAKWPVVGVVYETAGKDHFSAGGSRDVAIAIAREVFNFPPPYPTTTKKTEIGWKYNKGEAYEFFQIGGAKMSTSKGKGFPFSEMTNYAPGNILKYLLVKTRPKSVIEFDPSKDLDRIYRDFDDTEKKYFESQANPEVLQKDKYFNAKRLYELSHVGAIPSAQPPNIDFNTGTLLAQLTKNTADTIALLQENQIIPSQLSANEKEILIRRLDFFRQWIQNLAPPDKVYALRVQSDLQLTEKEKLILKNTIELINSQQDNISLNNGIKNISETHGLERKEYFKLMYNVLFGRDNGPKLTQYILFAGGKKIIEHINKVMN